MWRHVFVTGAPVMEIGESGGSLARELSLLSKLQANGNPPPPTPIHTENKWIASEEPHLNLTSDFRMYLYVCAYITPTPPHMFLYTYRLSHIHIEKREEIWEYSHLPKSWLIVPPS